MSNNIPPDLSAFFGYRIQMIDQAVDECFSSDDPQETAELIISQGDFTEDEIRMLRCKVESLL